MAMRARSVTWRSAAGATLAGLGAYYLVAALGLTVLLPVEFFFPRFGSIAYPELGPILAIVTAAGAALAAAIARAVAGGRAVAFLTALWAIAAASVVTPFLREGERAFVPPSDITGLTTATFITVSVLVGAPGILIGALVGPRLSHRPGRLPEWLKAAGAYYAASVLMSLPTPQLDPRLTLPFSAGALPFEWHALVVVVPAAAAGITLAILRGSLVTVAVIGAALGLAGAMPGEVPALTSPIRPYWPTSLVGVPLLSALAAAAAAYAVARIGLGARRRLDRRSASWTGAALGASGMLLVIAAWNLFGAMPSAADRDGSVDFYQRSGDERKIVACVVFGRGEENIGSSARETADAVYVTVRLRRPPSWYASDLVGIPLPVVVTLRDPLGTRAVIDARNGAALREVSRTSPTPVGSWC